MVHKLPLNMQNIVKITNTNPSMIEIVEKDKKEVELKIKGSTRLGKYEGQSCGVKLGFPNTYSYIYSIK